MWWRALLVLVTFVGVARADDAHPFGDVHVGAALITTDETKNTTSGGADFADGEVGLRNGHLYISTFGGYMTKHVDAKDPSFGPMYVGERYLHYRLHLFEAGVRLTVHASHAYGGAGLGYEWMVARGNEHRRPPPIGSFSVDRPYHDWDAWRLLELHGGYTIGEHLDVLGEFTYTRGDDVPVFSMRLGVGYRF